MKRSMAVLCGATATWSCSSAVAQLSLNMYLYRNDLFVNQSSTSNSGSSSLQGNVATNCTTDTYQAIAIGNVTFPPGYTPPTGQESVYSPKVYISCP